MRSTLPKILHPIAGLPMIEHVVRAVESLQPLQTIMVTGPTSEALHGEYEGRVDFAWQAEPLGTGHAVAAALPALDARAEWVLISYGDHPLTDAATLQLLLDEVQRNKPIVTMLAIELDEPNGEGPTIRMAFVAAPNGMGWTTFAWSPSDASGVTFFNAANDYPQRVRYWREGDELKAEISLLDGSNPTQFAFRRMSGG